jgi:hypothetical protein
MEREISIFPRINVKWKKAEFQSRGDTLGRACWLIAVFCVPSAHWVSQELPKFVTGKAPISFFWLGI